MAVELEQLEAQVLKLSPADRAHLLDRLILSLDDDPARAEAWDAVAAKRDAEIEGGQVVEVDGADAITRLRAKYR
jgi:Putative addiction module component